MGKIYIWGAGRLGESIRNNFSFQEGELVLAFVDNNTKQEREIPVLSPYNFKKTFNSISDAVLIAVENSYSVGDIFFQLHEMGINKNIFAVKADKWKKEGKIESIRDECIWGGDFSRKAVITKLEFHVCDHCNLNCRLYSFCTYL